MNVDEARSEKAIVRCVDSHCHIVDPSAGPRARREYTLTRAGRSILALLRRQVEELHREVVLGEEVS